MTHRILEFIKEYGCEHGYLPTYREIGEGVGLKSTSSVAYYMLKLSDDGKIDMVGKTRYRVRGMRYVRCVGN